MAQLLNEISNIEHYNRRVKFCPNIERHVEAYDKEHVRFKAAVIHAKAIALLESGNNAFWKREDEELCKQRFDALRAYFSSSTESIRQQFLALTGTTLERVRFEPLFTDVDWAYEYVDSNFGSLELAPAFCCRFGLYGIRPRALKVALKPDELLEKIRYMHASEEAQTFHFLRSFDAILTTQKNDFELAATQWSYQNTGTVNGAYGRQARITLGKLLAQGHALR